ncbi:DUF1648 domain-containing protein [Salinirubrum litoreum]|uniref:DUF1648 domain-containing protein n=1 Tax=Salinirubrum litoreum TaxID=1126234 RepID=A0ABD5RCC2_9EURY|nr:DUF1648 domain-containing protein [Salinirubrum litoreum]
MRSSRRTDSVALTLVGLSVVASVVLYATLPSEMAVQFSDGTPSSVVSKPVGAFAVPAVGVVVVVGIRLAPRLGLDRTRSPDLGVLLTGVIVAYVHALILLWNTGTRFQPTLAVLPLLVVVIGITVYVKSRGTESGV